MVNQTGAKEPGANSDFNSAKGDFGNPPLLVTQKVNADKSTQSSSVINQNVSGYSNPPGGKSPKLSKPARMRNR